MQPKAANLNNDSIAAIARGIAKELGFKPGGDIYPIVKALGGDVWRKDFWNLPNRLCTSLEVRAEKDFTIWLPESTTRQRDRFLIGHEIGHYVLHFLWPRRQEGEHAAEPPLLFSTYGTDRMDHEANIFSINFLAPADAFRKAWKASNGDVIETARRLDLTCGHVHHRAIGLGLKQKETADAA